MSGETCVVCGLRIDGVFVGMGDGTGQEFGHEVCYLRAENARLAAERDEYDRAHNEAMLLHAAEKARADRLAEFLMDAVEEMEAAYLDDANVDRRDLFKSAQAYRAALAAEPKEVGDVE